MPLPFSPELSQIADSMGIALYQRFTLAEAALFLRCHATDVKKLQRQGKIDYIEVTESKISFFGYQLLHYLLGSIKGENSSPIEQAAPDKILRTKEVQELTGLSRTTIWRLERKGEFPARVSLCAGSIGWRSSEVEKWVKNR